MKSKRAVRRDKRSSEFIEEALILKTERPRGPLGKLVDRINDYFYQRRNKDREE